MTAEYKLMLHGEEMARGSVIDLVREAYRREIIERLAPVSGGHVVIKMNSGWEIEKL